MKNRIIYYFLIIGSLCCNMACNDWLEVLPKNEQVTPNFWKGKEDVEAVLGSAYLNLRGTTTTLIQWGELRGGSIYAYSGTNEQRFMKFQLTSSDKICDWAAFYTTIGMANSVLRYAPEVFELDETYREANMNSHLTEAYFIRALTYFYLVRNFKDVPLVLEPYIDDSAPFLMAKSSEKEILNQIKTDIRTALETGAAKEFFESDTWAGVSKGRATKWALYALMADVCLWDEDYDECIKYADLLLNATAVRRPVFMADGTQWFEIFYPGNSNESIFEINWQHGGAQMDKSPYAIFLVGTGVAYQYSAAMCERLYAENRELTVTGTPSVRAEWGAYVDNKATGALNYSVWKYRGMGYPDIANQRPATTEDDSNWIVYRMTEVLLMKAEALIWKGPEGYEEAIELINRVRNRSGLQKLRFTAESTDESELMDAVLHERDIEFAAEGKRWYDLVRFGKAKNYKYKDVFIETVAENNELANPSWIRSVLKNPYAWYLPILESQIEVNGGLLVQNPYYGGTSK